MKIRRLTGVGAVIACLAGCASTTSPGATGIQRGQLMIVPTAALNAEAAQFYAERSTSASRAGKLNNDPELTARVRSIAARLIREVGTFRPDAVSWNWEVNVIDRNEINAYCAPGGKITVYSGLVGKLNLTDDELASVLGHEIGHALREHIREQRSQAVLSDAVVRGIATSGSRNAELKGNLAKFGSHFLVELPFSREMELEADAMGLELMARAGYDPTFASGFLRKAQARSGGGTTSDFFRTHPNDERRIAAIESAVPKVRPLYLATATNSRTARAPAISPSIAPAVIPSPVVSAEDASTAIAVSPTSSVMAKEKNLGPLGADSFEVEKMARKLACNADPRGVLTAKGPGFETYIVKCTNGDALAFRCEFGNCRVLQ